MKQGCKGCSINKDGGCDFIPVFKQDNKIHTCPCQTCVVKPICGAVCEEYIEFTSEYLYHIKEKKCVVLDIEHETEPTYQVVMGAYRDVPITCRIDNNPAGPCLIPRNVKFNGI